MTRLQCRTRQVKRAGNLVIWPVPFVDIAYPLVKAKALSLWPGSQVAAHQRVISSRILRLKLTEQSFTQPSDLCLINSTRMVSDETRKPTRRPVISNPPRTI